MNRFVMCFTPNFIDKKSVSIQRSQNSVKAESSPSGLCYSVDQDTQTRWTW